MDIIRAKELLTTLSEGVNPLTGEVLPMEDSCNQPDVIRALNPALRELDKVGAKKAPGNAGKPWTSRDDEALCQMFDAGKTRREMCDYFGRSKGAVDARLAKLGRTEDSYWVRGK